MTTGSSMLAMTLSFPPQRAQASMSTDHTVPYRYGFLLGSGQGGSRWNRFDHQTGKVDFYSPGPDAGLSEMCFVPRRAGARRAPRATGPRAPRRAAKRRPRPRPRAATRAP